MMDLNQVRNWLRVLNDTSYTPRLWQLIIGAIAALITVAVVALASDPIEALLYLIAGVAILSILYGFWLLIGHYRFRRHEEGQKRKPAND